jgi:hypothetical protein
LIRTAALIVAALLLAPALAACGKASSNTGPTVAKVYAGRVSLDDVTSTLGDAQSWAPGPPTFDVRPLNSASRDDANRFAVTVRFSHVGTREELRIQYQAWSSTTIATALMNLNKTLLGTSLTGPRAGDQSLYYNQNLQAGAAPYASEAFVRVGQTVITIVWTRVSSFANTSDVGKVAVKSAARLKDGLAGKVHTSPTPTKDPLLLAPLGPDLTVLGTDWLPVEVVPQILVVPNPDSVVKLYRQLGVLDFVYGDYALDADTRMEVLTSGFTFLDNNGAKNWLNAYYGASNLTSGVYLKYEPDTGQYVAAFGVGNRGVLMVCKSSAPGEEAARACEGPMGRVVDGWLTALATA